MTVEKQITVGTEVIFDGFVWGIVDEIDGDSFIVLDQDGGDHEITESRVDAILD